MEKVTKLIEFITSLDGIGNKDKIKTSVANKFNLVQDRSVFYCDSFAIRFSYTSGKNFSNTVLSLSALQKYDSLPFLVCVVTPSLNKIYLSNTTFLSKISHSSHELTTHNIKGSFNGSDIIKEFDGISNQRENITELFAFHTEFSFSENLVRLVEATNNIVGTKRRLIITKELKVKILKSIERAKKFNQSKEFIILEKELNNRVKKYHREIIIASHIENINIRGRLIEYLIVKNDDKLKQRLIDEINKEYSKFPKFKTENMLGDYRQIFDEYNTETDIKTKIMVLNSNPKAYNVDKFLEFLSADNNIFLFFFVGINKKATINTCLVSVFDEKLLCGTVHVKHWAGRNSRGVTQFIGDKINDLIQNPGNSIDKQKAKDFLHNLINL